MDRAAGRRPESLRDVKITRDFQKFASGSCLFELGDTKVVCAANVTEGVPSWRRGQGSGWVTAEYSMLPSSTPQRGRRETGPGGPGGRTHEIQRLIGRSLRSVIDMAGMGGEVTLTVDCDVIQADGGTRTAAITGAFIAVSDAFAWWRSAGKIESLPLLSPVAATSVGLVDGIEMLDLDYSEDSVAEVDMNVVMDGTGRYIEVQGTGERTPFDRRRLDSLLALASAGIDELLRLQREVLGDELKAG